MAPPGALPSELPAEAATKGVDRTMPMDSEAVLDEPDLPQDAMQADSDSQRSAGAAPSNQMDTSADGPEPLSEPAQEVHMATDTTPPHSVPGSAPEPSLPPSSALQSTRLTDDASSQSSTPRPSSAPHAAQNPSDDSSTGNVPAAHTEQSQTGLTSPSLRSSSDLAMTRIDRPRQHSLHQSEDTHSASTPASNSDCGTVHTSETSSGKSRAFSDDCGPGSLIQKLPVAVIDRILFYARIHANCGPYPNAIREDITVINPQLRIIQWTMMTWGMGWLFPLRMLCSNFAHAVRKHGHWEEYVNAICHARRERVDLRKGSYYVQALSFQRDMCFACSMNAAIYDARAQVSLVFAASLARLIPLCEVHETALASPDEHPALCSNCFLDERRFVCQKIQGRDHYFPRQDVDITYIEDEERFPQAESICSTCRNEAFFNSVWNEDPMFRRYVSSLRRTTGYANYVFGAEGTASEAAKSAIEQLWLETATGFAELRKHTQLQKRRERLKKLESQREAKRRERELLKTMLNTDSADSSSELSNDEEDDARSGESIRFEDEDGEGNILLNGTEERSVRDRAWHDWCKGRLELGLWRSAHDQQDAEMALTQNAVRNQPPRILVHGLPTKPSHEPVDDVTVVAMEAPMLPPMTLFYRACKMWDEVALPEFFRLPLSNIVEILKTREDGFELSLEMDFASLFTWLRKPEAWALPQQPQGVTGSNATAQASLFYQVPLVPNSPLDVGPGTVARIMEIWKRACAPLGECDCGICRRQKRKRSHDEVDKGGVVANNPRAERNAPNPAQTAVAPAPTVRTGSMEAPGVTLPGGGQAHESAAKAIAQQTQVDVQQNASPEQVSTETRPQESQRDPNDAEGPRKVARVEGANGA
ncbi:hypothetical protein OC846_004348 [Tilletia horrida]|uniref:Uncharacterized protein n=1 Tax=Tilletia horrida TaxID=155126 RepID=A0AAN6GMS6_9BASI|nr:hypothetical protein OC845_004400 [Tilletia horrida]KAK0548774.1 hypothetical protein OC846_004348 [Tilletia horrida]KAK0568041.1 hypothetical protein OC861_002357 [Tilletia horrida]